jgi:hypothetical protein
VIRWNAFITRGAGSLTSDLARARPAGDRSDLRDSRIFCWFSGSSLESSPCGAVLDLFTDFSPFLTRLSLSFSLLRKAKTFPAQHRVRTAVHTREYRMCTSPAEFSEATFMPRAVHSAINLFSRVFHDEKSTLVLAPLRISRSFNGGAILLYA